MRKSRSHKDGPENHLLLKGTITLPSPVVESSFAYNRDKMENFLVEERLSNLLDSKIFTIEELRGCWNNKGYIYCVKSW